MKLREKYWHEFFVIGIIFKSLTGLIETASGLMLLLINPHTLANIFMRIAGGGQPKDADDWMFAYAFEYLRHLSVSTKIFAGLYILFHGLINLLLVAGLIKQKLWAYLIAIGVLGSFIFYQIFRIAMSPAPLLEVLTVLDILFILVIWHEYKYQAKRSGKNLP